MFSRSHWPNPSSPLLSSIDFGVPLVELFKWLDVRDTLLGENNKTQDVAAALALARDCKHPDAEWLADVCRDVATNEQARKALLLNQGDARALCFAWWLNDEAERDEDCSLLRRAADMGYAFACSTLSWKAWSKDKEKSFHLARQATAQNERDGWFWLGSCFELGAGCEKDLSVAKQNYWIAAELGLGFGARDLSELLDESEPDHWIWKTRAALCGDCFSFVTSFSGHVKQFFSNGSGRATVVFVIGCGLKGNISVEKKEIFGYNPWNFDSLLGPANQAVSFYESQIKFARLAVDTWTLVSTRLHVIKDMRIFIGKMIWEARFEANYKDKCSI